MNNSAFIHQLEELATLLEIQGENEFKAKAIANGARALENANVNIAQTVADGTIAQVRGVGKGVQELLREMLETSTTSLRAELFTFVPEGVFLLTKLRGIGAKKARALWQELSITSIGELEYACNENRLIELKGFGVKTQDKILESIATWNNAQGKLLLHKATHVANSLIAEIKELLPHTRCFVAGEIARAQEIISSIDVVVESAQAEQDCTTTARVLNGVALNNTVQLLESTERSPLPIHITFSTTQSSAADILRLTASKEFLEHAHSLQCTEKELAALPTPLLDNTKAIEFGRAGLLPNLIHNNAMKGMLHVHTTYSDGANSIKEMALASKELGFEYIAICDHSKTAVYAHGLPIERVLQQHQEIDKLNSENLGITILKGIESDILSDGSLDYPDEILEQFDIVVASVHSAFNLSREDQTKRIERAVRNPYTTILGHPTGRLLLARKGYDVDMQRILQAAAETGTTIELNANPHRFDLDRSHHEQAVAMGIPIAINPDSHETATLTEVFLGVRIAQKSLLQTHQILNTLNCKELHSYAMALRQRKKELLNS